MNENYEKAIILEPLLDGENHAEKIEEIESLLLATSCEHFLTVTQKIREINPSTFLGTGKLDELKEVIEQNEVNLVVFDGELSPSQVNNISDRLDVKVITRTTLILDIFAQHALSPEGKILVELAQLKYLYPRLQGKGIKLSRLGGGIGTRGPGETKLETDRRHIKTRIKYLERNIKEIEKRRKMQQNRRERNGVKTVCLVGYTNTGKSTLLNLLCNSDVLAKDQLFATLDPTARKTVFNGHPLIIMDTVGFVKNLPPDLIEAFKSTLECAVYADLILNVCDISANFEMQIETTKKTLADLGATSEIITVANKCDKIKDFEDIPKNFTLISAKNNLGIEELKNVICEKLFQDVIKGSITLDYSKKYNLTKIKSVCQSIELSYNDDGTTIKYLVEEKNYQKLMEYFNEIKNGE